jgi:hypothetical protein
MTLTEQTVRAIAEAAGKATPGPYRHEGASLRTTADNISGGYLAETYSAPGLFVLSASSPRGSDQRDWDVAYLAMLDPETILAMCAAAMEGLEMRPQLAAGKRFVGFRRIERPPLVIEDYPPVARCWKTGNPVGTDTWAVGYTCPCPACQSYVRTQAMAHPTGEGQ